MTSYPQEELLPLLPIAIAALAGILALVVDVYLPPSRPKVPLAAIAVAGLLLAGFAAVATWDVPEPRAILSGAVVVSRTGLALALAVLAAAVASALWSIHYSLGTPVASGEAYGLALLSTSGMLALVVANDLATLFVAIETLSIAVYALTGIARSRPRAAEGAMKYFVLGAFSSGFLLYGIALVYGASGTLRLDHIARDGFVASPSVGVTGTLLILIGLLFKLGAVPFHSWVPDAYEGAPASVTGFMSVGVKAAALGAALRVLAALGTGRAVAGGPPDLKLAWLLWAVAAATIIIGNAGALTQSNPRRLLAYSGIAHTGYALVGLVAVARYLDARLGGTALPAALSLSELQEAARDAAGGVVFYAIGYGVANLAAFSVLCYLAHRGEDVDDVSDLAGLAEKRPVAALAMTVAMVSLAGVPATSGFVAKLWVFRAGIAAGDAGLVVLALLASALSLYYYLRIVVLMWMRAPGEPEGEARGVTVRARFVGDPRFFGARAAYALCALATLVLGVAPGRVLDLAASAAALF